MTDHNQEAERAAPCPFCRGELNQHGDFYIHPYGNCFFSEWEFDSLNVEKWDRRAPAVGEDGLPPLPEPKYVADDLTDIYTAEQVRQAQRDAVTADRSGYVPTALDEIRKLVEQVADLRAQLARQSQEGACGS